MKKVLIAAAYLNKNKHKLTDLLSERFKGKVEFHLDSFENFVLYINSEGKLEGYFSGINIKSFNFVYIRSKTGFSNLAKTVAICLEANNVDYADKAIAKASYIGNKLTSLSRLAAGAVPIPPSFYAYNLGNEFSLSLIKKLGFPLVVKDLQSQRMTGIFIIHNEKELKEFVRKNNKTKFIFQKHVEIENEYRIFVLEGKVASAHTRTKRSYASDKIGYLDVEESYEFIDIKTLPKKLIKVAQKAANELLLDIAGVDVSVDKNGKIFCFEVNRGPEIDIDYKNENPDEISALIKFFQQKTR